jgi:predicted XRE-type DNA-binding protein
MKTRTDKTSRMKAFLNKHISASPMTQREMATALGYVNPNMITILKQGDAKLPLDRVVAMAEVLNVNPKHLFALALEQYYGFDNANAMLTMLDQKPLEPVSDDEPAKANA